VVRVFAFLVVCLCGFAYGGEPADYKAKIQQYLSGLHALTADIKQYNPEGSVYTGKLWLKRYKDQMGKMRLDYNAPAGQRLLANKGELVMREPDGTANTYDINDTPAAFILRSDIDFDRELDVKELEKAPDSKHVLLTLTRAGDQVGPSLTLIFALTPGGGIAKLVMWEVLDMQGNKTVVELVDQSIRVNDNRLVNDAVFQPPF
jgi:outer membrane lipoprotein-sorting protein